MNQPKLGAWTALPAYLVLLLGMFFIGGQSQVRNVVAGLWITEAIAIALPALFVIFVAQVRPFAYFGLRKLTWKQALVAVVVATANQPVVSFLTWAEHELLPRSLVDEFDAQQRMLSMLFDGAGLTKYLMVLTVVIAAPLGEELFFRGYLFPALRKSWGVLAAMLVSGALFSLVHGEWVGFLGLMEIGVMLAALRLWSGSLWAAIIGHAVNNAIAGGAFLLHLQDPDEPTPVWALVVGAVFLVAGIVFLAKLLQRDMPVAEERAPRRRGLSIGLAAVWGVSLGAGLIAFFSKARQ
jgi:membrane protease YdiL (CAAX protease family)